MEEPPGCLVLLLRLSADMTAEVVTGRGEMPAFVAARFLADELLEALVNAGGALDVAVIGYRTAENGAPELLSLLPDGDPTPRFVPLAEVAEMPAVPRQAEGQPRKWTMLPACEGEPCATVALACVHQLVSVWLTGRYASRAPVIVHCSGADGFDDAYFRTARSLGLLAAAHGPPRVLNYVFVEPTPPAHLSLREGGWEGRSSERGWINYWDISDPLNALFTYSLQEESSVSAGSFRSRAMWAQKIGNTPEQWEDAFAVDEESGVSVIADGASSGIYCRIWAEQLCQRFLSDRPDPRDMVSLNKWVNGLRKEWRAAIDYDNLNWSKQAKVDQVGAAATLLALELGPADASGNRPWRASAVGDACLFWLRGGRLLATFPVVAVEQFGSAPLLVRSNPGFRTMALAAAGTCEPGDCFVLATDAVAAWLFKSAPDWNRYETMDEAEWREELDALRIAKDMVNDDCTLILVMTNDQENTTGASRVAVGG